VAPERGAPWKHQREAAYPEEYRAEDRQSIDRNFLQRGSRVHPPRSPGARPKNCGSGCGDKSYFPAGDQADDGVE